LWQAIGGSGRLRPRPRSVGERGKLRVWSARQLYTPAGSFVVGLEETTYLTVVCPLLRLPDFHRVFAASVATALSALPVPRDLCEAEAWAIIDGTCFAKNDNRSLLGSLNDVAFHVDVLLENRRRVSLAVLAYVQGQLNHMPHVHRDPAFPDQAARVLFAPASSA
jgi:hypothetical protein